MARRKPVNAFEIAKTKEVGFVYLLSDFRTEHDVSFGTKNVPVCADENTPIDVYFLKNVLSDYGRGPLLAMVRPFNSTMRERFKEENEKGTVMIPGVTATEMEIIEILDLTSTFWMERFVSTGLVDIHAGDDRWARYAFHHSPWLWTRLSRLLDEPRKPGEKPNTETAMRIQEEELAKMREENVLL